MMSRSRFRALPHALALPLMLWAWLPSPVLSAGELSAAPVLVAQAGAPPPGAGPPGAGGPPPMPAAHTQAGLFVSHGSRVASKEYAGKVGLSVAPAAKGVSGRGADGVLLTSTQFDATGIVVADGAYQFGGAEEYYTVYSNPAADYVGTSVKRGAHKLGAFNSVLLFSLDGDVAAGAEIGSSGVDADHSAVVNFDKVYMQVDGAQRYVDSTYANATTVVNDSYFVSTGNADHHSNEIKGPFSNEALFISGVARANFSINASRTYYFNSVVITEGWAALSTDASTGNGLDLYAYNTKAKALNGGYGTYADFGCRVWLYGSTLESAEVGAIISKSGQISVFDGASADSSLLARNHGKTTQAGTTLTAGRNAVMLHAPDMFKAGIGASDYGHLSVKNSTLATSRSLVSKFDYASYGDAAKKFVGFVSGDVILLKSTSAEINLDHAVLQSYDGVLLHSVLNSDRMGNFLAAGDNQRTQGGSLIVKPISLNMAHMSAEGAILHDDYQRNMEIRLTDAALTGRIRQGTYDSWKALWAAKNVKQAYWLPNDGWSGTNTLALSLDTKSSWTVTATSSLSSLSIAPGATLAAPQGQQLSMTVNGTATPIAAGSYRGAIVITPNFKD